MNPWTFISGFCKAANAALGIVPPLAWACLLALALGAGAVLKVERDSARSQTVTARAERDKAKGELAQLQGAVAALKKEAAEDLARARAEVADWQSKFNDARRAQEIKDANHVSAVDKAQRALVAAAAAHGGQLRDPWADSSRCGGGGADAAAGPRGGAGDRSGNAAEAGGLLSAELSRRLQQREREADDINIAYARCRADAFEVRGLPAPTEP